ncbi:MAG: hypothetical protein EPN99_05925 [Frankiales bacterium]|nr:MAG: hypothetical protein EPN99_05925 [Frankiales bacterium]
MEKLDYLLWESASGLLDADLPGARSVTVQLADDDLPSTLLMGSGSSLAALVQVWVASYDDRAGIEDALRAVSPRVDGYLVTESEPQPDDPSRDLLSHVTWFPKPERLTEEEFLRGWHQVHTPHSAELHPLRASYVRDTVVRTLTPGSPPVRAVVVERFQAADYADPRRLFGSRAALDQNMTDLPGYADLEAISCRPMRQVVLR